MRKLNIKQMQLIRILGCHRFDLIISIDLAGENPLSKQHHGLFDRLEGRTCVDLRLIHRQHFMTTFHPYELNYYHSKRESLSKEKRLLDLNDHLHILCGFVFNNVCDCVIIYEGLVRLILFRGGSFLGFHFTEILFLILHFDRDF